MSASRTAMATSAQSPSRHRYSHMAGDLADADLGDVSLTASDLVSHIGDAVMELTARRRIVNQTSS